MSPTQTMHSSDIRKFTAVVRAMASASQATHSASRPSANRSTAGQRGEAFHADYAVTKGGLLALTKSLAIECAPDITVNCCAPGWIDTDMTAGVLTPEYRAKVEASIPLGRIASADDVAWPILFLASPLARHITGEVLNVNGGSVLCG